MSAPDVRLQRLTQVSLTGGLLVVSMVLGLAGQSLIAFYFGAGSRSDSLFLARDIGDLMAKALLTTQAVGVLVPLVVALRVKEGPKASDRALGAILTVVFIAGTLLALVVVALADPLVHLLAPGFDAPTSDRAVVLLRIIAPMAPFVAVAALAAGALQSRHRFGRATVAAVLGSGAVLVAMPLVVHWWGVEGAAFAMTVGAIAQALCGYWFLALEGIPVLVAPWRERGHVREFARRTTPFFTYAAATQGSGATLRIAGSLLGAGLYAAFSLASRLYRSALTLLIVPVQQVLLPALSHSEAGGRSESSASELVATLRYVAFVLVPVTVALTALSEPTVSVVFQRGAFSQHSTEQTATVLALFSLALPPTAVYILLEQAAYARHMTRLIVRVNLGLEIVQGALYIPFALWLGAGGIPLVGVLATLGATSTYLRYLRPAPLRAHAGFAGRLAVSALAMLVVVVATAALVEGTLDPRPGLPKLAIVIPACLTGAVTYLAVARFSGLREPDQLAALLRSVPGARRRRPATPGAGPAP